MTLLAKIPLILDGATGTELAKAGLTNDTASELWMLEHEDAVLDLQGDIKHGRYNPLSQTEKNTPEWQNSALDLFLGDISEIYGFLPIVEYSPILDSIIYSGMTERYRRSLEDKKTGE